MNISRTLLSILFLSIAVFSTNAAELKTQSWLQFRGPSGDGIAPAKNVPTKWSEEDKIAWKTALPNKGWSSPVLQNGKIWITTAEIEEYSKEEFEKKLEELEPKKRKARAMAKSATLGVLEIDFETGEIVREIDLFHVEDPDSIHATNSYASPTPVLDGNRLYCYFGTFGTCCINTETGAIVWKHQIPQSHSVGPGSSPVLVDDLLILTCDGTESQFIVALNKENGKQIWRTERPPFRNEDGDRQKAFSTPLVVSYQGKTQVIIPGAQWFCSYDPKTGKENWRVDHGQGFSNVPAPAYKDGIAYLCTGFSSSQLWAVSIDGSGDVTDTHAKWTMRKQVPNKPSPVIVGNELYMISEKGIATCVDIETGDIHWVNRMSGNYSASPIFVDGKIYFCSEEGKTTVIQPAKEYTMIAENNLDGQIMATPVAINGALILRTDKALYRVAN